MIPLMEVLRVKPEGAARAGLVDVIPDTREGSTSGQHDFFDALKK